jgi:hypothetical protein
MKVTIRDQTSEVTIVLDQALGVEAVRVVLDSMIILGYHRDTIMEAAEEYVRTNDSDPYWN